MALKCFCLYVALRTASASSALCLLQDWYLQSWQNSEPLPTNTNGLLSYGTAGHIEWYNNNSNAITIELSLSIEFASNGDSYFDLSLEPCHDSGWEITLGRFEDGYRWTWLWVSYLYFGAVRDFTGADQDISSLQIDDGQSHLLTIVIDRISTASLHFNVSIDNTQQISFTFTNGMNDKYGVPVSDAHVMAIHEFGYSRPVVFWTDFTTVYLHSFSVSGIPMETNRYGDCSLNVTQTGAAPINPQPVSTTCSPTASPTESPTTRNPTTATPTSKQPTTSTPTSATSNPTVEPSPSPTIPPSHSDPPLKATGTPTSDRPTRSPTAPLISTRDEATTATSIEGEGEADEEAAASATNSIVVFAVGAVVGCTAVLCVLVFCMAHRRKAAQQAVDVVASNVEAASLPKPMHTDRAKEEEKHEVYIEEEQPGEAGTTRRWTHEEQRELEMVKMWLRDHVGLSEYYENFVGNGYEKMAFIKEMNTVEDLLEIGIQNESHQQRVLRAIANIA